MTDPKRVMAIMKWAFFVSVLLFILVTIQIPSKAAHPPQHAFELVIVALALINVVLGLNARSFLSRLSQARANNPQPLNQWVSANLVSLAMIESCALFALVLHMLGSSSKLVDFLFGCAVVVLFFWNPGHPPGVEDPSGISR